MKRFLVLLLIPLNLWMVTWLVTDVHLKSVSPSHHVHPLFSKPVGKECGIPTKPSMGHFFCSVDHGGHIGALALPLGPLSLIFSSFSQPLPCYAFSLTTYITPPPLRPPDG